MPTSFDFGIPAIFRRSTSSGLNSIMTPVSHWAACSGACMPISSLAKVAAMRTPVARSKSWEVSWAGSLKGPCPTST